MSHNNDSPQAPMTRPQQPHPLRCETCKNKKCPEYQQRGVSHLQYIDNKCIDSKNGSPKEYRVYSPKYFTELYGCAIHSSAPGREQPERNCRWGKGKCPLIIEWLDESSDDYCPIGEVVKLKGCRFNSEAQPREDYL